MPGHDDGRLAKAEGLIRKAFAQAGQPLDPSGDEFAFRPSGFLPGVELAGRYLSRGIRASAYHVRVRFAEPIWGPLFVGGGRFRGLGLFAAEESLNS